MDLNDPHTIELCRAIRREFVQRHLFLSVAESVTAGRIQALLTSCSGSSDYFAGGITAYTLEHKVRLLGVNRAWAQQHNCVSERTGQEMAAGVAALFQTPIALSITGYAEPDPMRSVTQPNALVSVWCQEDLRRGVDPALTACQILHATGTRVDVQYRFAIEAAEYLLEIVRAIA